MGISNLDEAVRLLAAQGTASSTSISYRSGVNRYVNFCSMYVLCPFPLSETILCRFVAFLVSSGLSYQSVRVYLSALRHYQLLHGGVDPCFSSLFRLHYVLRGVRRSLPARVRPCRLPITPSILRTLYHHWSQSPVSFNATCLWAACCLGFFGFLRSGEFTCQSWSAYDPSMLSVGDVEVDSRHSPSALHVSLRHSKTDVFCLGQPFTLVEVSATSAQWQLSWPI